MAERGFELYTRRVGGRRDLADEAEVVRNEDEAALEGVDGLRE